MHTFYLDSHIPDWLASAGVPLFVSNRRLARRTVREHDTGERILVYSLQRWYGTATVNAVTGRRAGADRRRRYLIELCSPTGTRCDMPLEILGLPVDHTYFGTRWPQKSRRRTTTKRSISSSPPSGANTASGRTGAGTSPTDRLTALTPVNAGRKRLRRCAPLGRVGPAPHWFAFWLPIVAGGPLRARPRPPLRSGHKARKLFPGRSLRSLGKLCARTLHFRGPIPAHISSARRQTERAATGRPSPRKVNHD